jgi:hypothetical protein
MVKNFRYCNGQLGMELHVIYHGTKSTNEQNSSIIIDLNFFVQAHVDDIGNQSIRLCNRCKTETTWTKREKESTSTLYRHLLVVIVWLEPRAKE